MNNEPLTVGHGGPVRLLVPGWAGIASTKWLVVCEVLDTAFAGFWNSDNYVYWSEDGTAIRPVREMGVKSAISAPTDGAVVPPGLITIAGYAWSGTGLFAGWRRVWMGEGAGGHASWSDRAGAAGCASPSRGKPPPAPPDPGASHG